MKKILILAFIFLFARTSFADIIVASDRSGYQNYSQGALVGTVTQVKTGQATIGGYYILNSAATICYLQVFDLATAGAVTLGTTVPTLSIGLPAGAAANIPATAPGATFLKGIQIASTTTRTGATPCGTGMDVNIWYQ